MKNTLLIFSFLVSACNLNKTSESLSVLNLGVGGNIQNLDPRFFSQIIESNQFHNIYDSLYERHPFKEEEVYIPNLATGEPHVSDDGKVYTVEIRKGAFFQDDPCFEGGRGREVTVNDLIYSFLIHADPNITSILWGGLDGLFKGVSEWRERQRKKDKTDFNDPVSGFKVLSPYKVQIVLNRPFLGFKSKFSAGNIPILAREAIEYYGKEYPINPVSSGPFIFQRPYTKNKFVFVKNPNFRKKYVPKDSDPKYFHGDLNKYLNTPIPFADKVVINTFKEPRTFQLSFQSKKIDIMRADKDQMVQSSNFGLELAPELKNLGVRVIESRGKQVVWYAFQNKFEFLRNPKLREAMALGFDQEDAVNKVFQGLATATKSFIPPAFRVNEKSKKFDFTYMDYDFEKAKYLLREAGYPNGEGLPEITLNVTNSWSSKQMSGFFTQDMAKLGIKIKVIQTPYNELLKNNKKQVFMMNLNAWWVDELYELFPVFTKDHLITGHNGIGDEDPEYARLSNELKFVRTEKEHDEVVIELLRILDRKRAIIPLNNMVFKTLYHKDIKVFSPYAASSYYSKEKN